jgi:hypothetical protein
MPGHLYTTQRYTPSCPTYLVNIDNSRKVDFTLNLASKKLIKLMVYNAFSNRNIVMKVANGDHHRLTRYVRVALSSLGVRKIVKHST